MKGEFEWEGGRLTECILWVGGERGGDQRLVNALMELSKFAGEYVYDDGSDLTGFLRVDRERGGDSGRVNALM